MAATDSAARRDELVALYHELSDCQKCPLAAERNTVVFGTGDADADLMFVGEAPGFHEDKQGKPFVGQAGKLLDKLLAEIGLERGQCFIANVLKCRPPGNRDPAAARDRGLQGHLFRQIELIQPRVVCTLGNFATKLLSGQAGGHHEGARRPAGARARRAHGLPVPDLPSGRRPLHAGDAGAAARRTSGAAGAARRKPLPGEPTAGAGARAEPTARVPEPDARAGAGAGRRPTPPDQLGLLLRTLPDGRLLRRGAWPSSSRATPPRRPSGRARRSARAAPRRRGADRRRRRHGEDDVRARRLRAPGRDRAGHEPVVHDRRSSTGAGCRSSHVDLFRLETLTGEDPALLADYLDAGRWPSSSGPAGAPRSWSRSGWC